jgi:hypothetical protein
MNQDSVIDKMVKIPLLTDMLNLVGVRPVKRSKDDVEALANGWPLPGMRIEATSPLTIEEALSLTESNYSGLLDADNYQVLFETEEEFQRRGNFIRVFPDPAKPLEYLDMQDIKKPNNFLVRRFLELKANGFNLLKDLCSKHISKS